jgi:RimJ/RimL family protein N-acetyltransferase
MQKLALKLGMSEEGRRREALWKNGIFADIVEYGLLNTVSEKETL